MRPKIRLSISSSLILLNTFLIVMTGLTVMFFSFTATKSSIHTVADNLLSEIAKSVLTKTQTYLLRDWKFALQHFNTVLKYRPGDGPSQVLAARCRRFMVQSPRKPRI